MKNSSIGRYCVSNWKPGIKRAQMAFLIHSTDHYCDSNWESGCLRGNGVCTQNCSVNKHVCYAWMRPTDAWKNPSYTKNGKSKICCYCLSKIYGRILSVLIKYEFHQSLLHSFPLGNNLWSNLKCDKQYIARRYLHTVLNQLSSNTTGNYGIRKGISFVSVEARRNKIQESGDRAVPPLTNQAPGRFIGKILLHFNQPLCKGVWGQFLWFFMKNSHFSAIMGHSARL